MKVVISEEGWFTLSRRAFERLVELGYKPDEFERSLYESGDKTFNIFRPRMERTDARLIKVVEELGEGANGERCILKIVEVPDDIEWYIWADGEWGIEEVHEKHRIWK